MGKHLADLSFISATPRDEHIISGDVWKIIIFLDLEISRKIGFEKNCLEEVEFQEIVTRNLTFKRIDGHGRPVEHNRDISLFCQDQLSFVEKFL